MRRNLDTRASLAIVIALAAPWSAWAQGGDEKALAGVVAVESVGDRQIMIAIDTLNEGRVADGLVDHVVRFVAESPLPEPVSLRLAFANLELRDGVLRLSTPEDGGILLLSVRRSLPARERPGRPGRDQAGTPRVPEPYRFAFTRGIELASYSNGLKLGIEEFAADPERSLRATILPEEVGDIPGGDTDYDDTSSGGSGGGCTSGGQGATSCGVTCGSRACSVSCGAGYYACCKCSSLTVPSCTCKAI